jgi:hypothetical protein
MMTERTLLELTDMRVFCGITWGFRCCSDWRSRDGRGRAFALLAGPPYSSFLSRGLAGALDAIGRHFQSECGRRQIGRMEFALSRDFAARFADEFTACVVARARRATFANCPIVVWLCRQYLALLRGALRLFIFVAERSEKKRPTIAAQERPPAIRFRGHRLYRALDSPPSPISGGGR